MKLYQPQLKYGGHVFEPGEYAISNEVYHSAAGISRSGIRELKKSPLHYYQAYLSPTRIQKPESKSMLLGEAVHTMLLEPDLFNERFVVSKKINGRSKEGKQAKLEFYLANEGKNILNEEENIILENIIKDIKRHKLVPKLLEGAKFEQSIFWIDSETELLCKARPDIWSHKYLADLKTTADSTYNAFCWSVRDYDYHIQAAMIIDAIKEITGTLYHNFVFIAAQTTPPYKPYLYNLGDAEIEHGRKEYQKLLKVLRICFDKNKWDSDREHVNEINLPAYFFNEQLINNLMDIYGCTT